MFFNLGHFIWSSHALMKMAVFAARRSFCKFESQNKIDPTPSRESEETGSGFLRFHIRKFHVILYFIQSSITNNQ